MRGQRGVPEGCMKIYMKLGKPPLCLPEAVADTVEELAELCGVAPHTIENRISSYKYGRTKRESYCAVIIDKEDE